MALRELKQLNVLELRTDVSIFQLNQFFKQIPQLQTLDLSGNELCELPNMPLTTEQRSLATSPEVMLHKRLHHQHCRGAKLCLRSILPRVRSEHISFYEGISKHRS